MKEQKNREGRRAYRRYVVMGFAGALLLGMLVGCTEPAETGTSTGPSEAVQSVSPSATATPTPTPFVDDKTLEIGSSLELSAYMEDGVLTLPEECEKVCFSGELTLAGVTISAPVDVRFEKDVVVEQVAFSFISEESTAYTIVTSLEGQVGGIVLDTPNSVVNWEGVGVPDSSEYVEQYANVQRLNDLLPSGILGGKGNGRITGGTLGGFELVPSGNYIYLSCTYSEFNKATLGALEAEVTEGATAKIKSVDGMDRLIVTDSAGETFTYRLMPVTEGYTLPVVYLNTQNNTLIDNTDVYVSGAFSIDYNGCYEYENLLNVEAEFRGRGYSSWKLDKKPYKVKLSSKESLFGLTKAKEWVLQANAADKSLMRNTVAMAAGSVLTNMLFIPHSYLVDVFVNGEYMGVYSLTEQVEFKKGRLEYETDPEVVDTNYLLEIGGEKTETSWGSNIISSTLTHYIEIRSPKVKKLTEDQYNFIKKYINTLDKTVSEGGDYESMLDVASLIDWFLLDEFSYNIDCTFHRSGIMLKKSGGKLYMAVPWDFDYAFGNFSFDSTDFNEWICLGNDITDAYKDGAKYIKENWMDYLLEDPNFVRQLKARWDEVGEAMYQAALDSISANVSVLAPSAVENFAQWSDFLGKKIQFEDKRTVAIKTWDGQVEYLQNFCTMRYEWMDHKINEMYEELCK